MAGDRKEKARVFLAESLERAYLLGFLTFRDVVRHIGSNLVPGLVNLVRLHGEKALGPFYARWRGEKKDNIPLFLQALVGHQPFLAAMLENINGDDVPEILGELIETSHITWLNLVTVFPLWGCLERGVEDAKQTDRPAAGAAAVIEEDVLMEVVAADADEPTDESGK